MGHQCNALILTCMDFRIQQAIVNFAAEQGLTGSYDLLAVAGAQKAVVEVLRRSGLLKDMKLAVEAHGVMEIILIGHEDCGAYGGSAKFPSPQAELDAYRRDLDAAKRIIAREFPCVSVAVLFARQSHGSSWRVGPLPDSA